MAPKKLCREQENRVEKAADTDKGVNLVRTALIRFNIPRSTSFEWEKTYWLKEMNKWPHSPEMKDKMRSERLP